MKKIIITGATLAMAAGLFAGCGQSKDTETVSAATDSLLDKDVAKTLVLADAKVSEADISGYKILYELEGDVAQYDIEFYVGDEEYDYEINAKSGVIITKDVHDSGYDADAVIASVTQNQNVQPQQVTEAQVTAQPTQQEAAQQAAQQPAAQPAAQQPAAQPTVQQPAVQPAPASIDIEKAKSIALSKVPGAASSNISKAATDVDNGMKEYDIDIVYNGVKYEFEIASNGDIISSPTETISNSRPQNQQVVSNNTHHNEHSSASSFISLEEAKSIALAKIPGAGASNIVKAKSDMDDGMLEFEIDIVYGQMEYEFEIDGNGRIIKMDTESVYD